MGPAHRAAATPLGVTAALLVPWGGARPLAERIGERTGLAEVAYVAFELLVHLALGLAVVGCAKWNDLDHPRLKGKRHPGAALVRLTARIGYRIRTPRDRFRTDLHRGPSHCLEWCVLAGVAVGLVAGQVPWLAPWAFWWGLAIFLGTSSHVWIDALTPSGVPISALFNFFWYDEVWRRHAFAWKTTQVRIRVPWPMVSSVVTSAIGRGQTPATLPALLAYSLVPGVRATTTIEVAVHTFAPAIPRVALMPVDEKAPGCEPGLVTTDSGAEHFILVPLLHGATLAAFLAATGLLWPIASWLFA